jgi:NifB/MoaA-like Fe-S oxidoreductase
MEIMKELADGGIDMNCQIVLCKGINDGAQLDRTLGDLNAVGDHMKSISVVPVGLTNHRKGLFALEPFNGDDAADILTKLETWQCKFLKERGVRLVYPADEFFVLVGKKTPAYEYYDGFPQLENGVGMISLFRSEFEDAVKKEHKEKREQSERNVYIATGFAAAEFIGECTATLNDLFGEAYNTHIEVVPIVNNFFGGGVTVTGLLTGSDIINALKDYKFNGNSLLCLSKNMFRHGTEVFLDDFELEMLRKQLKVDIIAIENNGYDFLDKVLRS